MRILWQELKKIVRQSLGTENMFGYRSTVANQLYLLYCFSGHIYFTDKVDKRVKYFWYSLVSSQLILSWVLGWSYLWYDDKNDLVLMLNMATSIGCVHMEMLGFPFILHLFGDRIEAMIECVDRLMNIKLQTTVLNDVKKYFSFFFIPLFVCTLVFLSASFLDVILFFEQDKVSNYVYYAFPPPLVQKYSSFASFMMATCVTDILFVVEILEVSLVLALMLYWSIICCGQMISIKDGLESRTRDLNLYSDAELALLPEWRRIIECTLKRAIREFQIATRLMKYMRGCVESIGTIYIIATFCYGVALLYACLSVSNL
ncbi:uncharacterized protein LOC135847705 [Planococcus citri]|uniref:uncharacterized protein LOC135847705 n=1 Tax=Planococcus citri TaxID=170843 RepID=UPI0031F72AC5